MLFRILKKDLSRGRVLSVTLLLFLLMAALLTGSALGLAAELSGAMDALFEASRAPHFVQMHAGEMDREAIDAFAAARPEVTQYQIAEMYNISGSHLYLGSGTPESESVMENALVAPNDAFDFLLDGENQPVRPAPGEIGVPVYYLQNRDLAIGDTVRISDGTISRELTVSAFVRDAQMNSSMVTSKRFVVHPSDLEALARLAEVEYLLEFRLEQPEQAAELEAAWQAAGMPSTGTAVTWSLYRMLTALSDGLVIGVILLMAALLVAIALLCLRFSIVASMEEDYREIGVMKALGLPLRSIRRLYLVKYTALAAVGCLLGYLLSLPLSRLLSSGITLYMGRAGQTPAHLLLPLTGCLLVFLLVPGFCRLVMRRFRSVTAVEAIRGSGRGRAGKGRLRLHRSRMPGVNLFLGMGDVISRPRRYGVLALVFVLCTFLMILPLNLLTTLESPDFIACMGAARSDLRMDLTRTDMVDREYQGILDTLEQDAGVERFAGFVTAAYRVRADDGSGELLKVENGDFRVFPLDYLEGTAPETEAEIALSALNAGELERRPGDTLHLLVLGEWRELTVTGIYQDVTNGGRTAKGHLPWAEEDVLWYVVNLDLAPGASLEERMEAYREQFPSARVLDMDRYLHQTLGSTISRVRLAARLALLVSVALAACITALFLRMLLAGDRRETVIQRGLGFTRRDIAVQYGARALLVLLAGILLGVLAVNLPGEGLLRAMGGMMGAPGIRFSVRPWLAWGLYPLCLALTVASTTVLCTGTMEKTADIRSIAE